MFTYQTQSQSKSYKSCLALLSTLEKVGVMTSLKLNRKGMIIQNLDAFLRFFRVDPSDVRFKGLADFTDPENRANLLYFLNRTLEGQEQSLTETVLFFPTSKEQKRVDCQVLFLLCDENESHESTRPVAVPIFKEKQIQAVFIPKPFQHLISSEELQSQRLAGIGAMAAGVAHDLNNLFTGCLSFAHLLRGSLEDSQMKYQAALIEKTIERASTLSKSLLNYVKGDPSAALSVDPVRFVRDTIQMVRPTLRSGIQISASLPKTSYPIPIGPSQFNQVILNLILNARDAIEQSGSIFVNCYFEPAQKPSCFTLQVTDSGCGIKEEDREKIFNPFFTTKGLEHGTGIGLTIVKKIIEDAGGEIFFQSTVGKETTFTVKLPVVSEPITYQQEAVRGGHEHLLVWNLDPSPGRPLAPLLTQQGYQVTVLVPEQMDLSRRPSSIQEPKVLIVDLTDELHPQHPFYRYLHYHYPQMKLLLCTSGYAKEFPEADILQKPFSPEELWKKVRRTID